MADNTQILMQMLQAMQAQGAAAPAQTQRPALPTLSQVRAAAPTTPAPAPEAGPGFLGAVGNGLLDIGAGAVKGLADGALGAVELGIDTVDFLGDAVGQSAVDLTSVMANALSDDPQAWIGRMERAAQGAGRDRENLEEDWVAGTGRIRDAVQTGADAIGVGGSDGMIENISRAVAPALVGGLGAAGRLGGGTGAVQRLWQGSNNAEKLVLASLIDGGVAATAATETRDDKINRNLANMLVDSGIVESSPLASAEGDSDLARRSKMGIHDMMAGLAAAGLLTGGAAAVRGLRGAGPSGAVSTPEAAALLREGDRSVGLAPESAIDPSVLRGAAGQVADDSAPAFVGARGFRMGGGAGAQPPVDAAAQAAPTRMQFRGRERAAAAQQAEVEDILARNPIGAGRLDAEPGAVDIEDLLVSMMGRQIDEGMDTATLGRLYDDVDLSGPAPAVAARQEGPLAIPDMRITRGDGFNMSSPSSTAGGASNLSRRLDAEGARMEKTVERPMNGRVGRQDSTPTESAALLAARSMEEPFERALREVSGTRAGERVPMARIGQMSDSTRNAKAVAKRLQDEGLIVRTNKGFIRTAKPVEDVRRPFEGGPVPTGRAEAQPAAKLTQAEADEVSAARARLENDIEAARGQGVGDVDAAKITGSLRAYISRKGGLSPKSSVAQSLRSQDLGPGKKGVPPGMYAKTGTGLDNVDYDDMVERFPDVPWKRAAEQGQPGYRYVDPDQMTDALAGRGVVSRSSDSAIAQMEDTLARLDGDEALATARQVNTPLDDTTAAVAAPRAPQKALKGAAVRAQRDQEVSFRDVDDGEVAFSKAAPGGAVPVRSPEAVRQIEGRLRSQARKYGFSPEQVKVVSGWVREAGTEGAYSPAGRTITISALAKDPMGVMNHELFHALRPLLSAQENKVLERAAKAWIDEFNIRARYPDLVSRPKALAEEAMAEFFRKTAAAGVPPTGILRGVFEKIQSFLTKTRNFLRGEGFTSPEAIMKALASGRKGGIQQAEGVDDFVKFSRTLGANDAGAEAAADGAVRAGFSLKGDADFLKNSYRTVAKAGVDLTRYTQKVLRDPKSSTVSAYEAATRFANVHHDRWMMTTAGSLRAMANKYKVPGMIKMADKVRYTRDGGQGATFDEIRSDIASRYGNRLSDAMKGVDGNKTAYDQVRDVLVGADAPAGGFHPAAVDAARKLRPVLDAMHKEAADSGINIGYTKNYFPRKWDEAAVIKDPEGFVSALTKALEDEGMEAAKAVEHAKSLLEDIQYGRAQGMLSDSEMVSDTLDAALKARWERVRALGPGADTILKPYLNTDPVLALQHLASGLGKRVAWERVIGQGAWDDVMAQMKAANVPADEQEVFANYMKYALNLKDHKISRTTQWYLDGFHTLGTMSVMSHSLFASLAEPMMVMVRTGSVSKGLKSLGYSLQDLVRTANAQDAHAYAKELGAIANVMQDNIVMARANMSNTDNIWTGLSSSFYRRIFMTRWTDASRVGAMRVGETYIQGLMRRVAQDGSETAKRELKQLGLSVEDAKALAGGDMRGASRARLADGTSQSKRTADELPIDRYNRALLRFTKETILTPTAATRPAWANHPFGRVVYALTSYMFAFQTEVLNRGLARASEAFGPGVKGRERLELALPMVMMAGAWPIIQAATSEIRYFAFNPERRKEMTTGDRVKLAISRSGITGIADYPIQAISGVKYRASLAGLLAGPYGNHFSRAAGDMLGYALSDKPTNSTERSFARGVFNAFVLPTANGLAAAVPFGAPVSGLAASASIYTMPVYGRNLFVDGVAGKAQ